MQRNHIRRQLCSQRVVDLFGGDVAVGGIETTQELTARLAVETFDDSLVYPLDALHGILHLTWFHTLSVDFYHPVFAVHIHHIAVRQLAHDIVGVQPSVPIKLGGALRVFVITLTEMSSDHEFSLFTVGNRFPVIIQQHPFCRRIGCRTTHRC